MSGAFIVAHVSDVVGLDVLLRASDERLAMREVSCSGPTAHLVHFGALRAVSAELAPATRAQIERALEDGTHPALRTPSTPPEVSPAPTSTPPLERAPEPPPAAPVAPVLPAISPAPKPARALPQRTAPVAAKLPVISPAEPSAPSSSPVDLCPRCGVAPVRTEASGERGLWCDPCRDAVVRKLVGKRGGR